MVDVLRRDDACRNAITNGVRVGVRMTDNIGIRDRTGVGFAHTPRGMEQNRRRVMTLLAIDPGA